MSQRRFDTQRLVTLSVLIAIIILQTWVPFLGNINIPPFSITFIHVTVIVTTLWLGTKEGMIIGLVWGLNSLARSLIMPVSPLHLLIFSSPLVSVLPRVLMPLVVGGVAMAFHRKPNLHKAEGLVCGMLGSLLNTVFVLGAMALFKQSAFMQMKGVTDTAALWKLLGGIVVANGIPEMIVAGLVTPILLLALRTKFNRQKQSY
ncbi:ECF transporter S component [Vaginisenegalia massiliensis]|uniref:ECF transporter S component n=1 Tax=Vaginisenegalia massiliensis TaxID=2058294 RepID=UPI0013DD8AF7|nr:ECF transporter S component [Vaginisenegalia massiliensis]